MDYYEYRRKARQLSISGGDLGVRAASPKKAILNAKSRADSASPLTDEEIEEFQKKQQEMRRKLKEFGFDDRKLRLPWNRVLF